MNNLYYILFVCLLFLLAYLYFRIARIFNIIDVPNHRTMHEGSTIRGGGIIILAAFLIVSLFVIKPGYWFLSGLVLIGIIGFLDDIIDLPSKIRFPFQIIAVLMISAIVVSEMMPSKGLRGSLYALHASLGFAVLALSLRLLMRCSVS